jgi:hypothetical protein
MSNISEDRGLSSRMMRNLELVVEECVLSFHVSRG